MVHVTTHSDDIQPSPARPSKIGLLLRFFAGGIRDMNRYLDAASLVHSAGKTDTDTDREQSWEGRL